MFSSFSCSEEKSKGISIDNEEIKSSEGAINKAKKTGQYLFIIFHDKKDEVFLAMEKEIEAFRKETPAKSMVYKALITDKQDAEVVQKYQLSKVKLPAVLIFAPNGVVTGGFQEKVEKKQLERSIVSDLDMKIMKPLQEGKIALVLIQNDKTKLNKESSSSAEEFKSDPTVKGMVETVVADPSIKENKKFLSACKLDENMQEAVIVVLIPPGVITGVFKGKTDKSIIFNSFKGSSCGSGGAGCASGAPGCTP